MKIPAEDPRIVPVLAAIHQGDVDQLRILLRNDPDLVKAGIVDAQGVVRTPLHAVADWPGHFPNGPQTVSILIAAGADVNAVAEQPHSAETALHWAASSDDVGVLDALLDGGADIEAPGAVFTGGSPMSDAVVFAQWRAARRLLERGATTTLWQAAALGLLQSVQQQANVLSDTSQQQITNAFWHACRGGQPDTAKELFSRGAELNWVGYDHKTPLDAARASGVNVLIQWLENQGARSARGS